MRPQANLLVDSPYQFDAEHIIHYEHGCFYEADEPEDKPFNQQALEAEANARLIAAAPELLEAVKSIRDAYKDSNACIHCSLAEIRGKGMCGDHADAMEIAWDKVDKAIAKAEGSEEK